MTRKNQQTMSHVMNKVAKSRRSVLSGDPVPYSSDSELPGSERFSIH